MATTTMTFRVEGMHCASCGMLIDDTVEDLDGVRRAQTSVKAARTTVELDPAVCQPADVVAAIAEAGYRGHPE
ncbi:MAG: heavy-metal-associated domain-containing protein [Micromonosporaceae bacterium]